MKVSNWIERNLGSALIISGLAVAFFVTTDYAQQGAAPAQKQATAPTTVANFTATTANVTESGTPVRINILRWSSDEERNALITAFTMPVAPAPAAAAGGGGGRGGRGGGGGGGRGARGDAPAAGGDNAAPAAAGGDTAAGGDAAAGRGGGRGGRDGGAGGGRGARGGDAAPAAPAAPPDPVSSLTSAIGRAPTVGYIWTNEAVGYSVKYAYRIPSSDGGERVVLVTDRRLGGYTSSWNPKTPASGLPNYEFSVIELRLNSKGLGEGKSSLTTKVTFDADAKTLGLENYAATASVLQNVKRQ